jgi:hypothetical protein
LHDQTSKFKRDAYKHFNGLLEYIDDTISMRWFIDWNIEIDHLLTFELWGGHIWARYKNHATFNLASFATQIVYAKAMVEVKF